MDDAERAVKAKELYEKVYPVWNDIVGYCRGRAVRGGWDPSHIMLALLFEAGRLARFTETTPEQWLELCLRSYDIDSLTMEEPDDGRAKA